MERREEDSTNNKNQMYLPVLSSCNYSLTPCPDKFKKTYNVSYLEPWTKIYMYNVCNVSDIG